jgi:hypothetical protein
LYLLLVADCFAAGCSQHSAANFLSGLCRSYAASRCIYVIDIKTLIRLFFSFDPDALDALDGRDGLGLGLKSWRETNNLGQAEAVGALASAGVPAKLATLQRWGNRKALAACGDDRRSPEISV